MAESSQHRLDRVRTPRVHLTYDVEVGGAIQKKELPFVVGVLADLSGKPAEELPKLRDRKFVDIDRDNFNKVLASMKPRLAYQVDNVLQNDGTKFNVELEFGGMDDFSPEAVARRVEPLRKLLEARKKLDSLVNKLDGNDKLEELLQEIVSNTDALQKLSTETGRTGAQSEEG